MATEEVMIHFEDLDAMGVRPAPITPDLREACRALCEHS